MSTIALGTRITPVRPLQAGRVRTRPATSRPAASRPVTARPSAAPLRLTRRGRVAATLVFLAVLLTGVVAAGARSAATDHPGTPVPTRTVVVAPGDTLWQIASEVASPGEVRAVIGQIEELNALPGAALRTGQRLAVPVSPR